MSHRNTIQNIFSSTVAILLLGLYLSADLIGSLHTYFVHEEQTETVCTLENEEDSCHRTIYHNDTTKGCDHPSHLVKPIVKCELCSMLLTTHILPVKKSLKGASVVHVPVILALEDRLVTNPATSAHGLRGPPSFS